MRDFVEVSMTKLSERLAMENGATAMDSFVNALDDAAPMVMQHEPSMAAGIGFARSIAVRMAEEFRKQLEERP